MSTRAKTYQTQRIGHAKWIYLACNPSKYRSQWITNAQIVVHCAVRISYANHDGYFFKENLLIYWLIPIKVSSRYNSIIQMYATNKKIGEIEKLKSKNLYKI